MSYNTRYALSVFSPAKPHVPACCGFEHVIQQLCYENKDATYGIYPTGATLQELKWYDHEDDLRRFSKKHPELVFKLSGEGEENGDIWDKYFQNGKMQVCRAEVMKPPFDPSELG